MKKVTQQQQVQKARVGEKTSAEQETKVAKEPFKCRTEPFERTMDVRQGQTFGQVIRNVIEKGKEQQYVSSNPTIGETEVATIDINKKQDTEEFDKLKNNFLKIIDQLIENLKTNIKNLLKPQDKAKSIGWKAGERLIEKNKQGMETEINKMAFYKNVIRNVAEDVLKKTLEDSNMEKLLESGKPLQLHHAEQIVTAIATNCNNQEQFIQVRDIILNLCKELHTGDNKKLKEYENALVNIIVTEAEKKGVSCFRLDLKPDGFYTEDVIKEAVIDAKVQCHGDYGQLKALKDELGFFSRHLKLRDASGELMTDDKKKLLLEKIFSENMKEGVINPASGHVEFI